MRLNDILGQAVEVRMFFGFTRSHSLQSYEPVRRSLTRAPKIGSAPESPLDASLCLLGAHVPSSPSQLLGVIGRITWHIS